MDFVIIFLLLFIIYELNLYVLLETRQIYIVFKIKFNLFLSLIKL